MVAQRAAARATLARERETRNVRLVEIQRASSRQRANNEASGRGGGGRQGTKADKDKTSAAAAGVYARLTGERGDGGLGEG